MIDLDSWKKVWALLHARERQNAWIVLSIVVFSALSSALMVGSVLPFLSVLSDPTRIDSVPALAWAYEAFGFESNYGFLVGLGLTSLFVIIFGSGMQILRTWVVARFAMMRIHSLSYRLLAAYLGQDYAFFLNRHSGEMGTRILAETQQLVQQLLRPAAEAIAAILTIVAVVTLLLWVQPIVALVAFSVLGGLYWLIYWLSRRALNRLGRVRVEANSARFRIANEALNGIKDIKLLGRERAYLGRFRQPSQDMAKAISAIQVVSLVPKFALEAIAFGGIILLCLALMAPDGRDVGAGLASILPVLGLFAFAGQRLMPELQKLYYSLAQIQAGTPALEAVHEDLINQAGDRTLPTSLPTKLGLRSQLVLDHVSYRYPTADHAGICDLSIEIKVGERIGIVGSTGSGKTTLADLMLGLLAATQGRITVDGLRLAEDNLRAWQQGVGYVPQDIFLIDASISENIAFGMSPQEIDEERVLRAAKIARIDTFIREELPEGYATTIGERGMRLSGGQRQRIGIARALYHDADLIVFDEATSALDNLTEAEVMGAIEALPGDKTVLMIAHRMSTIQNCDRIILMDRGRIAGVGSWRELEDCSPLFLSIVNGLDGVSTGG